MSTPQRARRAPRAGRLFAWSQWESQSGTLDVTRRRRTQRSTAVATDPTANPIWTGIAPTDKLRRRRLGHMMRRRIAGDGRVTHIGRANRVPCPWIETLASDLGTPAKRSEMSVLLMLSGQGEGPPTRHDPNEKRCRDPPRPPCAWRLVCHSRFAHQSASVNVTSSDLRRGRQLSRDILLTAWIPNWAQR